jgi:hypothetical protein
MSCVAEANASSQKNARVILKKNDAGIVSATLAKPRARTSWVMTIHHLFVLRRSTRGLQIGLMTHGR